MLFVLFFEDSFGESIKYQRHCSNFGFYNDERIGNFEHVKSREPICSMIRLYGKIIHRECITHLSRTSVPIHFVKLIETIWKKVIQWRILNVFGAESIEKRLRFVHFCIYLR